MGLKIRGVFLGGFGAPFWEKFQFARVSKKKSQNNPKLSRLYKKFHSFRFLPDVI